MKYVSWIVPLFLKPVRYWLGCLNQRSAKGPSGTELDITIEKKSHRIHDSSDSSNGFNTNAAPLGKRKMTAAVQAQTVAIPGQLLGPLNKYSAGPGTHIHESNLYSSLLGTISITQPEKTAGPAKRMHRIAALNTPSASSSTNTLPAISVSPANSSIAEQQDKREVLPEVGNIVLCRVTRITPREATVLILVVGDAVLSAQWQGVVRVQDVRATEKDRVKIYESFRPGDIVRAQVVSSFRPRSS